MHLGDSARSGIDANTPTIYAASGVGLPSTILQVTRFAVNLSLPHQKPALQAQWRPSSNCTDDATDTLEYSPRIITAASSNGAIVFVATTRADGTEPLLHVLEVCAAAAGTASTDEPGIDSTSDDSMVLESSAPQAFMTINTGNTTDDSIGSIGSQEPWASQQSNSGAAQQQQQRLLLRHLASEQLPAEASAMATRRSTGAPAPEARLDLWVGVHSQELVHYRVATEDDNESALARISVVRSIALRAHKHSEAADAISPAIPHSIVCLKSTATTTTATRADVLAVGLRDGSLLLGSVTGEGTSDAHWLERKVGLSPVQLFEDSQQPRGVHNSPSYPSVFVLSDALLHLQIRPPEMAQPSACSVVGRTVFRNEHSAIRFAAPFSVRGTTASTSDKRLMVITEHALQLASITSAMLTRSSSHQVHCKALRCDGGSRERLVAVAALQSPSLVLALHQHSMVLLRLGSDDSNSSSSGGNLATVAQQQVVAPPATCTSWHVVHPAGEYCCVVGTSDGRACLLRVVLPSEEHQQARAAIELQAVVQSQSQAAITAVSVVEESTRLVCLATAEASVLVLEIVAQRGGEASLRELTIARPEKVRHGKVLAMSSLARFVAFGCSHTGVHLASIERVSGSSDSVVMRLVGQERTRRHTTHCVLREREVIAADAMGTVYVLARPMDGSRTAGRLAVLCSFGLGRACSSLQLRRASELLAREFAVVAIDCDGGVHVLSRVEQQQELEAAALVELQSLAALEPVRAV